MNWYKIFYWLSIADTLNTVFQTIAIILCVASVIAVIGYFTSSNYASEHLSRYGQEDKDYKGWMVWVKAWRRTFTMCFTFCLICTALNVFIPSKKDALMIIAGGAVGNFLTTDSSSKAIPADITRYLHKSLQNEIKDLDEDTRRELGVQTPKEKLADKLEELTKEQIIELLKKDSTVTIKE
jgi:ABC-type Fe3+ transport system permease subunit